MDEPHIELNTFVKLKGLAPTGGQAKLLIRLGRVKVNGVVETRNRRKLTAKDAVEIDGKRLSVDQNLLRGISADSSAPVDAALPK